jgi:hypothetical protein
MKKNKRHDKFHDKTLPKINQYGIEKILRDGDEKILLHGVIYSSLHKN